MDNTADLQFAGPSNRNQDVQVVAFKLGREEYAVNILNVQEINHLLSITRVPRTDKHIKGVVNLRGNIIPVIDLHSRFNLISEGDQDEKRIIVFNFEELKVGIIVDEVSEVLHINSSDIEETSNVYNTVTADHIKGIAKVEGRLLIMLDLKKLFE